MTSSGIGPESGPPSSSRRRAAIVAGELRRQILEGELLDGTLLRRQELVVRFDVSTFVLRQALRILETERLVSVRFGNRGGAVVHAPRKASAAYMLGMPLRHGAVRLRDLAIALQELEPTCAVLAAGRPDRGATLIPTLRALNESMNEQIADVPLFAEIGGRFHDEVVRGCGNHTVIAVVGSLETLWNDQLHSWARQRAARGRYPSMAQRRDTLAVHAEMTDAIEAGNAERVRKLAGDHLSRTQSYLSADDLDQRIIALPPQIVVRP